MPDFDSGALDAAGKRVIVVGGGDTAMDCVRTAVRQGATSVACLYRRDRDNMPGSQREVGHAEEEGVEFVWLSAPQAFGGKETVENVLIGRMRLGAPDASGRRAPEPDGAAGEVRNADLVIKALGFDAEDLPQIVRRAGTRRDPLGDAAGRQRHADDQPRRRVRRRRHRPRREPGGVGGARRA